MCALKKKRADGSTLELHVIMRVSKPEEVLERKKNTVGLKSHSEIINAWWITTHKDGKVTCEPYRKSSACDSRKKLEKKTKPHVLSNVAVKKRAA